MKTYLISAIWVKNRKVFVNFKIETPKNIWIDEFICLRSEMYACKSGNINKNKLKGVSKSYSKKIKLDEYKNCLDGSKYKKECDNYFIRSLNHEMYLHKLKKSSLSLFDEKRCYENNIESKPWNFYH